MLQSEQYQKAGKEVARHLAAGKDEHACIFTECFMLEDYLVEAMEILELHCDLLLARPVELDSGYHLGD